MPCASFPFILNSFSNQRTFQNKTTKQKLKCFCTMTFLEKSLPHNSLLRAMLRYTRVPEIFGLQLFGLSWSKLNANGAHPLPLLFIFFLVFFGIEISSVISKYSTTTNPNFQAKITWNVATLKNGFSVVCTFFGGRFWRKLIETEVGGGKVLKNEYVMNA